MPPYYVLGQKLYNINYNVSPAIIKPPIILERDVLFKIYILIRKMFGYRFLNHICCF